MDAKRATGDRQAAFACRAVIEGFYGLFYTHPERLSLLRFLGAQGYNEYIYAPKNDRQHRSRWREPYPQRSMSEFGEAVRVARDAGIEFCYAIAPGIDISYSSATDFELLVAKLRSFHRLGVRRFAVLLDDIRSTMRYPGDAERYESLAIAQADLCNRVRDWLQRLDPQCRLVMCPTEYHGSPPFGPALHQLGSLLHRGIGVFYTGTEVCSATVGERECRAFAEALGRKPLLWDNYPVNDLAMSSELHIGPVRGRAPGLAGCLAGVAVNPMNQAEASKVALATYGDYLRDPVAYDPEASWRRALSLVAGDHHAELRLLAENSLRSCLAVPEAERLGALVEPALIALEGGNGTDPAVARLHGYLSELDEACYALRYRMENLQLRHELVPWAELLEDWSWLGRWSIEELQARSREPDTPRLRRIAEYLERVERHHKRIAGDLLRPLAAAALQRNSALQPA